MQLTLNRKAGDSLIELKKVTGLGLSALIYEAIDLLHEKHKNKTLQGETLCQERNQSLKL